MNKYTLYLKSGTRIKSIEIIAGRCDITAVTYKFLGSKQDYYGEVGEFDARSIVGYTVENGQEDEKPVILEG